MGESELQILITAVDEASGTMAEISEAVSGMAEEVTSSTDAASESFGEFGLQINATTGEIENALLTQNQSFALAAEMVQQSSEEIINLMAEEGVSAEEAAAVIAEADATIAASGEAAASSSAGAYAGLAAIAGIAFLGIKDAIGDAVSSAVAWDETSAVIAKTLKDTGSSIPLSQIQAYAQQVQATTLFTQQDVLQSEELILTHKNLQGSFEQVTGLAADLATKMGTDLPSATKILTNALSDPVAGMNQLIRQGNVDFPAATVTMIENMAKAGDTAGADTAILQALTTSIGGVATAAAGAPGAALTQLSNQLTALGTIIGKDLLPLLDTIATDLEPIIQDIGAWAAAHPKLTDALVLGSVALAGLLLLVGLAGVAFITITPIVELAGVVIAALTSPIGLVVIAIVALAAAVYFNWNTIRTDTETVWTDISNFIGTIWATIQNTVKTGIDYVISAINGFINALDAIHISIPSIAIPGTKLATPSINLGFSIPDIPMLAEGGFVTQPTLAIIGEAGPEAVMPLSRMGTANGGGFSGQQIVVNINGGIFPADQSAIKQIGDLLAKTITQNLRVRNYQP
jgi:anion-transporting  ArsA/GET3 family ATPase